MKYGQDFRFGHDNIPSRERMGMIKSAGFDGIMTWWGHRFARRDGRREDIAVLAKENGLELFAFHSSYHMASKMWDCGEDAKKVLNMHISNLEDCDKFGCRNLVVHVAGVDVLPTFHDYGLENFRQLFMRGDELGVNVAIENVAFTSLNRLLIENLNNKSHKSCYDSGHDNFMSDDGDDVLSLFEGRLAVTHLHDNYADARKDSHFLIGDGDVDFARVANMVKKENLEAICLESRNSKFSKHWGLSAEEYLAKSLEAVRALFE